MTESVLDQQLKTPYFVRRFFDNNADGNIGIRLRYKGTKASATITVASDGNLTFKHGAAGSEAVDASVGLPTKNGVYDVSDTTCNTYAKIRDDVLGNSTNWDLVLGDVDPNWSSNDTLKALSETAGNLLTKAGHALYRDIAVAQISSLYCLSVAIDRTGDMSLAPFDYNELLNYPPKPGRWQRMSYLDLAIFNVTGSSAVTRFKVYEIDKNDVSNIIYNKTGAATTVDFTFPPLAGIQIPGRQGCKNIAVYTSDVQPTAWSATVQGRLIKLGQTIGFSQAG